jgi:tripartite-type tricarboxylate transporter receptor subunit TctC
MIRILTSVFFVLALTDVSHAQDYPNHSIRLIVPYTPGGPADILARLTAQKLSEPLGQAVVVENRGGGSGMIGTEAVAKARPDGYVLLFGGNQTHGSNPSMFTKMPYDPVKDFTPMARVASAPFILTVTPSLPVASVRELIALAKSQPGRLNFSSAGTATGTHLAGELLKSMAQVDMTHVPYKGGGDSLPDVLAGRIQITFTAIPAGLPFIKSGKLKALAVTGKNRFSKLPDLPTVAETLNGFEMVGWYAVFGPAGTPAAVVTRWNYEVNRILRQEEVKEQLSSMGAEAMPGSPEQLAGFIREEIAKFAKVIKAAGIEPE